MKPPTHFASHRIYRFHRLGSGKVVSAAAIVRALRIVRSNPLDCQYRETLTSPIGFGGNGYDVLRAFSAYCQDAINERGVMPIRNDTPHTFDRQQRRLCQRARPSECRWCGTSVGKYVPDGRAFCDASCYRSFHG